MVPPAALNSAVAHQLELDVHRETLDHTRDLVNGLGGVNQALRSDNPEVVHQANQYREASIALKQHRVHQARLGLKPPVSRPSKRERKARQQTRQHAALSKLYAHLAPAPASSEPDNRSSKQVYRPNLKRWENPKFGIACDPAFPLTAGPEAHTYVGPVAHSAPQGPAQPPPGPVGGDPVTALVSKALAPVALGANTGPAERALQAEAEVRAEGAVVADRVEVVAKGAVLGDTDMHPAYTA